MILSENDYNAIIAMMDDECGSVEYEKDGELLCFDYDVEINGYREDDYFNGTGAWVTTDACVGVINVHCYDEDGEEVDECNFDEYHLCEMLEKELKSL